MIQIPRWAQLLIKLTSTHTAHKSSNKFNITRTYTIGCDYYPLMNIYKLQKENEKEKNHYLLSLTSWVQPSIHLLNKIVHSVSCASSRWNRPIISCSDMRCHHDWIIPTSRATSTSQGASINHDQLIAYQFPLQRRFPYALIVFKELTWLLGVVWMGRSTM
jgi:hypothetical protein